MKDSSIILWSFVCGCVTSLGILVEVFALNGAGVASAANVSPFVTFLGIAILAFKPIFFGAVTGLGVFLLLGFLQVASRKQQNPSTQDLVPKSVDEAIQNALNQFQESELVRVRCPKCSQRLQVARYERNGVTVVACSCGACRREFSIV